MKKRGMFVATWTLGVSMTLFGTPVFAEETVPQQAGAKESSKEADALVNIEIKNAPVLGDVDVKVLSGDKDGNGNLAEIQIEDTAIVGDAHVGVADRHTSANEAGNARVDEGLVEVNTKDTAIVGDAHVGVADRHTSANEAGDARVDEGLVEVNTKDTAIVGDAHVGVADRHHSATEKGTDRVDEGLVEVNTKDTVIVGDVHAGVLDRHEAADSQGGKRFDAGVVQLNTAGTALLNDVNLGILDRHSEESSVPKSSSSRESAVNATLESLPLLGDVHLGVLESVQQADSDGMTGQNHAVELLVKDGLLGNINLVVLERDTALPAVDTNVPPSEGEATPQPGTPGDDGAVTKPESPSGNNGNTSTDSPNGENVEGNGTPKPGIPVENQGNGTVDPNVPADAITNGGQDSLKPNIDPAVESPVDQSEGVIQEAIVPGGMPWVQDLDSLAYGKKIAGAAWKREHMQSADRAAGPSGQPASTNVNWAEETDNPSAVGKLPNTGGYQYALYLLALLLMGSGYAVRRFPKQG